MTAERVIGPTDVDGLFALQSASLPEAAERLRLEVREFVQGWRAESQSEPRCDSWLAGFDAAFSARLGQRGWVGMTWPRQYGGGERSALERYVVTEELLAAGSPVAAHWIADRQSGPSILRFGTEEQKRSFLPRMAAGTCYFAIGMSEPDSGSDLASVRMRATKVDKGWLLNGTKIWTSHAHLAHYMIVLCRTSPVDPKSRHSGLSQFIVDLRSTKGVTVRPIKLMTGKAHFNEVVFDNAEVGEESVLGKIGEGWHQVTAELVNERSGPERFLSTFAILPELCRHAGASGNPRVKTSLARLWSKLWVMRRLSISIASMLDSGGSPAVEAALVKVLGTELEQEIVEVARDATQEKIALDSESALGRRIAEGLLYSPGFTLRGGSNQILRGIVARQLGLR